MTECLTKKYVVALNFKSITCKETVNVDSTTETIAGVQTEIPSNTRASNFNGTDFTGYCEVLNYHRHYTGKAELLN